MSDADRYLPRPRRRALRRALDRRGALVLVGLFVAGWLLFIFAGALARASDLDTRLDDARARTDALLARVEAGYEEIAFAESDTFLEHASAGLGLGIEGEEAFTLPEGAPPPATLPPLGGPSGARLEAPPLDAWLEMLFGP